MNPQTELGELLGAIRDGRKLHGVMYLPEEGDFALDTACLVVDDDDAPLDENGIPLVAARLGLLLEGLDLGTVEEVVHWVRQFDPHPKPDLLLESFTYYWNFDAFLPAPGAPDPPSAEEIGRLEDLRFYEGLGAERSEVGCRRPECDRGAVHLSVFCRIHHFENIKGRPCPFQT